MENYLNNEHYLGKGGFGEVYWIDEDTAIKVLHVGGDETLKRDTLKEIQFMINLKLLRSGPGYENIVHINGFDEGKRDVYIKMDRASCSMKEFIGKSEYNELSLQDRISISQQYYCGLAFLHTNRILHQDLKPDNILFFGLVPKLCDFGLSRQKTSDNFTRYVMQHPAGTLMYMAPEVFIDEKTPQLPSDVWSLGITSIEWFTGKRPWTFPAGEGNLRQLLREKHTSKSKPDGLINIPDQVKSVLETSFSYNPSERPTAAEILEKLKKINDGIYMTAGTPEVTPSDQAQAQAQTQVDDKSNSDSGNGQSVTSEDALRVTKFVDELCDMISQCNDTNLNRLVTFWEGNRSYMIDNDKCIGDELATRGVCPALCDIVKYMSGRQDDLSVRAASTLYYMLSCFTLDSSALCETLCEGDVHSTAAHHLDTLKGLRGEAAKDALSRGREFIKNIEEKSPKLRKIVQQLLLTRKWLK